MSEKPTLTTAESEVVILLAVYDLIDSIANRDLITLLEGDETELVFKDSVRARYFNLALVDLLSQTDKDGPLPPRTYLQALHDVCDDPRFDVENSVSALRRTVSEFRAWLRKTITVKGMWLPSISLQVDLRIERIDALKIAGNICKHNVLRSIQTVHTFQKVLAENGITVERNQVLLTMDEVYEWLHTHKFLAQSHAIVEFLNNIRWGIYDYLMPEYQKSKLMEPDGIGYRYTYPDDIQDTLARTFYWDLMNKIRADPYLPRFTVREFWGSG